MDLEFPVALDEDEEQAIVYLNCLLRLSNILSEVLCMLYPIKKPPLLAELLGDEYERTIVVQLGANLRLFTFIPHGPIVLFSPIIL